MCVFFKKEQLDIVNRWILSRFYSTLDKVARDLDNYKFNEAANSIYAFFWHEFCDWYLELIKPQINQKQTQIVMYKVLEKTLRIIHPFMPFITEEIWQRLPGAKNSIMQQSWPHLQKDLINLKDEQLMQTTFDIINTIRNMRSELEVGPGNRINIKLTFGNKVIRESLESLFKYIKNLAKIDSLTITDKYLPGINEYVVVLKELHIAMPLAGIADVAEQIKKNRLKIEELRKQIKNKEAMLANKNFIERAPLEIVDGEKTKLNDMFQEITKLEVIINGLR